MSIELYIPPTNNGVNKKNGQFLKGHIPHYKGKRWSEWIGKRKQRRAAKGWKNLEKFRPKERPDNCGRCRKEVIAVFDDGTWKWFPYVGAAAQWIGGSRENVGRCCRYNYRKRICQHDWRPGQGKGASRINTDHRYKGVRWYFNEDDAWTTKVKD